MSNLSECADLSFKLFECVICALRHDSKFLYGDISLLVCPLVHLSTGPRANLLLNLQIIKFEYKEFLSLLKLFF